jgi:hypothetical protein
MIAPRGLFIMDNPHIANLGPRSASVAALGGAEVYKALGAGDNITYWSDVSDGTHCANRSEWRTPLQQNIRKFLLRTGNDPGVMRISSRAQGRLSDWIDWTTPALSTLPTSSPTASPSSPPTSPPPTSPPPTSPPPTSPPPTSPPPTSPPPSSAGCSVTASVNAWTGGFVATLRVTAGSGGTNGWTVRLSLPAGAAVTNAWSAGATGTSGAVQFGNVAYNGRLTAGQVTEFGFQGTGSPGSLTPACTAT